MARIRPRPELPIRMLLALGVLLSLLAAGCGGGPGLEPPGGERAGGSPVQPGASGDMDVGDNFGNAGGDPTSPGGDGDGDDVGDSAGRPRHGEPSDGGVPDLDDAGLDDEDAGVDEDPAAVTTD